MNKRGKSGPSIGSATLRCKAQRTCRGGVRGFKSLEDGLPRIKEENLEKASRSLQGYEGFGR